MGSNKKVCLKRTPPRKTSFVMARPESFSRSFSLDELTFYQQSLELINLVDIECPICLQVMLYDPCLVSCCGHHFCFYCITRAKRNNSICPYCNAETYDTMADKGLERRIKSLSVRCTRNGEGCDWKGELLSLVTHLMRDEREGECLFTVVECKYRCGHKEERSKLYQHETQVCPKRPHQCGYCSYESTYSDVTKEHFMNKHKDEVMCVSCDYEKEGCGWRGQRRESEHHYSQDCSKHLKYVYEKTKKLERENESLKQQVSELWRHIKRLQAQLQVVYSSGVDSRAADTMSEHSSELSSELGPLSSVVDECQESPTQEIDEEQDQTDEQEQEEVVHSSAVDSSAADTMSEHSSELSSELGPPSSVVDKRQESPTQEINVTPVKGWTQLDDQINHKVEQQECSKSVLDFIQHAAGNRPVRYLYQQSFSGQRPNRGPRLSNYPNLMGSQTVGRGPLIPTNPVIGLPYPGPPPRAQLPPPPPPRPQLLPMYIPLPAQMPIPNQRLPGHYVHQQPFTQMHQGPGIYHHNIPPPMPQNPTQITSSTPYNVPKGGNPVPPPYHQSLPQTYHPPPKKRSSASIKIIDPVSKQDVFKVDNSVPESLSNSSLTTQSLPTSTPCSNVAAESQSKVQGILNLDTLSDSVPKPNAIIEGDPPPKKRSSASVKLIDTVSKQEVSIEPPDSALLGLESEVSCSELSSTGYSLSTKPHALDEVELHKATDKNVIRLSDQKIPENKEESQELLFRKLQSILDNLSPHTFADLAVKARALDIDTEEKLCGCVDMIYERALEEPQFSKVYASLCRVMSITVHVYRPDGKKMSFRRELLTKCQEEFEEGIKDDNAMEEILQAIAAAPSKKKRKQKRKESNEWMATARRRSLGNIQFIGELFNLKLLTEGIMHDFFSRLLLLSSELSLECFCQLMTATGKELDYPQAKVQMDRYFKQISEIIKKTRLSHRIMLMIHDVQYLRKCNWVPQR